MAKTHLDSAKRPALSQHSH